MVERVARRPQLTLDRPYTASGDAPGAPEEPRPPEAWRGGRAGDRAGSESFSGACPQTVPVTRERATTAAHARAAAKTRDEPSYGERP